MTIKRIILFLSPVLLLLVQSVEAQTAYYEEIHDATSYEERLRYVDSLNAAAERLAGVFANDATVQSQFKVLSGSFYRHTGATTGGVPEAMEMLNALAAKKAPYYLLIGKESNELGMYQKFWVSLKLPEVGQFPCFDVSRKKMMAEMAAQEMNRVHEVNKKRPYKFAEAEKAGMAVIQGFLKKFIDCCPTVGARSSTTCSCEGMDTLTTALSTRGMLYFDVADITAVDLDYGNIDAQHQITLTNDNCTWNLTDELSALATGMGTAKDSIKVRYFDDLTCFFIWDYLNEQEQGPTTASARNSATNDFFHEVIVLKKSGVNRVFFRFSEGVRHELLDKWIFRFGTISKKKNLFFLTSHLFYEKCFGSESTYRQTRLNSNISSSQLLEKTFSYEATVTPTPINEQIFQSVKAKGTFSEIDIDDLMQTISVKQLTFLQKYPDLAFKIAYPIGLANNINEDEVFKRMKACYEDDAEEETRKWYEEFVIELMRATWCAKSEGAATFTFTYTGSFSYNALTDLFRDEANQDLLDGINIIAVKTSGTVEEEGIYQMNITDIQLGECSIQVPSPPGPSTSFNYKTVELRGYNNPNFKIAIAVANFDQALSLKKRFENNRNTNENYNTEIAKLHEAIDAQDWSKVRSILNVAPNCLYRKIRPQARVAVINEFLQSFHTNTPEEIIIAKLIETAKYEAKAFADVFESSVDITSLFDAIDNLAASKAFVRSLLVFEDAYLKEIGQTNIKDYFYLHESAFQNLDYRIENKEIVIISTTTNNEGIPIQIGEEIRRFGLFQPVVLNFSQPIVGEQIPAGFEIKGVPGLLVAYYIRKDNIDEAKLALQIGVDIGLAAVGVSEVTLAIQLYRRAKTAEEIAYAAFRVTLAIADFSALSADVYCRGNNSQYCRKWREVSFYVGIGLITASVADLSIELYRQGRLINQFDAYPNVQKWLENNDVPEELGTLLESWRVSGESRLSTLDNDLADANFFTNFETELDKIEAWLNLLSRGVSKGLRTDLEVLNTLSSYKKSSIASRVDGWDNHDFLEHFEFIKSNPSSANKFRNYLDNGTNFTTSSGIELKQFLRIILDNPPNIPYHGSIYRSLSINSVNIHGARPHIISDYSVQNAWGRYDLPSSPTNGGEGALYCSKTLSGNETEITHYGDWLDFHTYEYTNISLSNLLDLTNSSVRKQLGVDFNLLTRVQDTGSSETDKLFNYEFTNVLGSWIRNRYDGVIVPGARGAKDYSNIVLFNQNVVNNALGTTVPTPITK
ncbi:MAG: hypothetical protein AAF960_20095 [Bacteroidota bacterium]